MRASGPPPNLKNQLLNAKKLQLGHEQRLEEDTVLLLLEMAKTPSSCGEFTGTYQGKTPTS